jgi:heptaprenyl diphosphate synthase
MNTIWSPYPELERQLKSVKDLMNKSITLKNSDIEKAILAILNSGGKMLRPAYFLLFANYTKLENSQKQALAAAIELLHTATLIHDDVVDKAQTRRGTPTISKLFGADVAVYAGDYLFVQVFKLLSKYSVDTSQLGDVSNAMERLLGGELGQMDRRFDYDQSMADYLNNIAGKTAELFAQACAMPAAAEGNKLMAKRAYDIGENIGLAFQIIDDYLDYAGDAEILGKPVMEDIQMGVFSAPLLYAIAEDKTRVKTYIENGQLTDLHDFIKSSGALDKTRQLANDYTNKALKLIGNLPAGETRDIITTITSKLLERNL